MPAYCTPLLEFSTNPLSTSNAAATWTDVTSYLKEASWSSGVSRDLDQPQAGGATFVLRNKNRDWEPEFSGGRFAGNVVPMRRFRWSITADGSSRQQGIYFASSYQVTYPDPGSTESDVVVTCVDGFGILSLYPLLRLDSATDAETYSDVVQSDNPVAYYPLNDLSGRKMSAVTGPEGVYRGTTYLNQPNPVLGDAQPGISRDSNTSEPRAKMDDVNVFSDANAFTIEAVVNNQTGSASALRIAAGPQNATSFTIELDEDKALIVVGTSTLLPTPGAPASTTGRHHYAATWDGTTLTHYQDGVVTGKATSGATLATPSAGEYLYIGQIGTNIPGHYLSHVAFYNYAMGQDRINTHVTAALSRGYDTATAGSRISSLATHPLWSTASIPAGSITVAPRFQHGQAPLDEILDAVQAETPQGLFFFNDAGNPDYVAWEDTTTIQATFGEQEVQYDDIGLVYDDQLYNQATVGREGGQTQTASDSSSQSAYSVRAASDLTGLIIQNDTDAKMIAQAIVDHFSTPMYRIESVTLNAASQSRRTQILLREVGDYIRIKRRGAGGTANPDIVTRIIGKSKHLDVNRHLTCTWSLARGFSAATQVWHLSQSGYSELNTATILA